MRKIELLSPAGDLERLKVTLLYGADAVYIGGEQYSLRANANNFSIEEIREGCSFAHQLGKKVHLTLNIVFHNEDMDGVWEYISKYSCFKYWSFIISYIKKKYPQVEVHLSTQNSTSNYEAIHFFEEEGVDRVVLARELSKKQIEEILEKVSCDIEVFIHGAMCTCFSGRCALSNYVTNRDANRGGCAQVCRFSFENSDKKEFTFATKDMNMASYISDLIAMGVRSLKVEGRMRSLYYLAVVIGTYRAIIDDVYHHSLTDEKLKIYQERLDRVANRETSSHFFLKDADYTDQYYSGRSEVSNQDYLGQVISYDKMQKRLTFYERNYFEEGDTIELFTPGGEHLEFVVSNLYHDKEGEVTVARHPDDTTIEIPEYSMLKIIKRH